MGRIQLSVDIEGIGVKLINVRRDLAVRNLINEIRSKYEFVQGAYSICLPQGDQPLKVDWTLEQLGLEDGVMLRFVADASRKTNAQIMIEAGERIALNAGQEVFLQEEREGFVYTLNWQPSIIGRADPDAPSQDMLLAVDLTSLRGAEYVSRHHACITVVNDQYFLESITTRNKTWVNNESVQQGTPCILQPGDNIRVGRVNLVFHLRG